MNHYAMQMNAFAASGDSLAAGDRKSPVLCPKPRRLGPILSPDVARPLRWYTSHQAEQFLESLHSKGGDSPSMSPPFFCGSPPARAGNPVVHDARFGEDRPLGPLPMPTPVSTGPAAGGCSPMSPRSSSGCARTKISFKPAAVRVEGFDCLDRGRRRGCSITAVA